MLELENWATVASQWGRKLKRLPNSLSIAARQSPVWAELHGEGNPLREVNKLCTKRGSDKTPGGPESLRAQICPLMPCSVLVLVRADIFGFYSSDVHELGEIYPTCLISTLLRKIIPWIFLREPFHRERIAHVKMKPMHRGEETPTLNISDLSCFCRNGCAKKKRLSKPSFSIYAYI